MEEEELENEDMKKLLNTLMEGLESQLDPDLFQDDNDVQEKEKATTKYSNTKVKTKNLLTNVSYRRNKPEDVEKTNFVINVFSFLTQNLNSTGLDRKLETPLERDYVKMIWDSCVPHEFTKFIYLNENFMELSQPHIIYPKANNIVVMFVEEDMQILSQIDMGDVPKQLEFSEGGQNKQFEDKVKLISLSTDSIEFLEFLHSSFCQELLIENKLRIHIESRNIFFKNLDTNESINEKINQKLK